MKDHHEATPQVKHSDPTTNGEVPLSPENSKHEENREIVQHSAFDDLLKLDEAFYRTECRLLVALAALLNVPLTDREDMTQEAWVSVVEHRDQFQGEKIKRRVHCWLETVIYRKTVDLQRHLNSYPFQSMKGLEREPSDVEAAKRVESAELREYLEALLAEVGQGNDESLSLVRAHFFEGSSISALADQRGMTAKSVEGRIRRLLEKIREHVEKLSLQ